MIEKQKAEIRPYFKTQNFALVAALATAGFEWSEPQKPLTNDYNADVLKRLGFATMEQAIEAGEPGIRTYFFARTPELEKAIEVFNSVDDACAKSERTGKAAAITIDVSVADTMTIIRMYQTMRHHVNDLWRQVPGEMTVEKDGKPRRVTNADGSKTITSPGFVKYSSNLNADARKKLGV